jgi:hypothetical protein
MSVRKTTSLVLSFSANLDFAFLNLLSSEKARHTEAEREELNVASMPRSHSELLYLEPRWELLMVLCATSFVVTVEI